MTFIKKYSIRLVVESLQQSRVFAMARALFTKLFTYYLLDLGFRKGFIIVYERVARFHQWYRSINPR